MKISYQELLELTQEAIDAKYPPLDPMGSGNPIPPEDRYSWTCRFTIENLWDDQVFVSCKERYCDESDPDYGLMAISVDETGEDATIILGDMVPMKLVAVALDGSNKQIDVDLEAAVFGAAVTEAWDGSKSRFTTQQLLSAVPRAIAKWARSQAKKNNRDVIKSDLHLPYKEPGGQVNLDGVRNALARAPQVQGVPAGVIASATRELKRALLSSQKRGHQVFPARGKRETAADSNWEGVQGESFHETFENVAQGEFDSENLIVKRHKVLGVESKNGRRYPLETQKKSVGVFEGAKAYLNHPKAQDMGDARDVRDLIGEHRNVRVESDGTYSDLHLLDNPTVRDFVVPVAKKAAHLIGSSIVVKANMKKNPTDGIPEAQEILACRSIDLVAEPATTRGLYESKQKKPQEREDMEMKDLTVETLRKERSDLVDLLLKEGGAGKDAQLEALRETLKEVSGQLTKLEARDVEREKQLKEQEKKNEINTLVAEAKLPDAFKYDIVDGKKTIKKHILTVLTTLEGSDERAAFMKDLEGVSVTPGASGGDKEKDTLESKRQDDPTGSDSGKSVSDANILRFVKAA